jgi:hypothetical protein
VVREGGRADGATTVELELGVYEMLLRAIGQMDHQNAQSSDMSMSTSTSGRISTRTDARGRAGADARAPGRPEPGCTDLTQLEQLEHSAIHYLTTSGLLVVRA